MTLNLSEAITVEKTVVFEASPAEERVEGVQRLLPLHRLGERSVQVGRAQRRQLHRAGGLQEVLVPVEGTREALAAIEALARHRLNCSKVLFSDIFSFLTKALSDADVTVSLRA